MSDDLHQNPWPEAESVVFLCDCMDDHENDLLQRWLRSTDQRPAGSPPPRTVPLDLGADRPRAGAALRRALQEQDDTAVVPLRVAWLPERDANHSAPRIRDLVLGDPRRRTARLVRKVRPRDDDRARCIAGEPATVGELRSRFEHHAVEDGAGQEDFADYVLRQAGVTLDVQERKLQGRRYKVPRSVIGGIEGSRRYKIATAEMASELGRTTTDLRAEARQYLTELVAAPNRFFIDWAGTLTRWITSLGYHEVVTDPDNVERARALMSDYPSALLWTHKSHVDAVALLSVMYDNDFPAPHSMGGMNMAFKGVGYAGRRAGTVFIRRSFADNPIYKLALQQYLGYLMEKRFPLSWAFEGTRSRTGKLGPPRYGLLKYSIDAAHATETEDLHLIPVSINYDLVGETDDYAREEAGAAKEAESLHWAMSYLRRLRSPKGNIYLDFAEPVVLPGKAPAATDQLLAQSAFEVARRVNERVPVTLPSLLCLALLAADPRALTYAELNRSLVDLLGWLRAREVRLTKALDQEELAQLEPLAESVFDTGIVERVTEGSQTLFLINKDQYPVASFYRNTIIHYFVNKALAEVALATVAERDAESRPEAFWDEVRWLRDLTKFEFFHTPSDQFTEAIELELDSAGVAALSGTSAEAIAALGDMAPLVSHAVLLPYLEAYWLVAKVVAAVPETEPVNRSEAVTAALKLGRTALRQRRIASEASIGKAMFAGALSYLSDRGLLEPTADSATDRAAMVQRLEDTLLRIRQVGATAHAQLFSPDART